MTVSSKEEMEDLLRTILQAQKEVINLAKSLSDDPVAQALMLHTACNLILDDHEAGSEVIDAFKDTAPKMDAIVDLGYASVLKSLENGSYNQVFSTSVEIAANDIEAELNQCPACLSLEELGVEDEDGKFGLN